MAKHSKKIRFRHVGLIPKVIEIVLEIRLTESSVNG